MNISPEIFIPILTFVSVITIGASVLVIRAQKKKALAERLQDDVWTEIDPVSPEKKSKFLKFLEGIGNLASHGHATATLWEQLMRAGYFSQAAPAIYTGIKMLLFIACLVGVGIVLIPMEIAIMTKLMLLSLCGIAAFILPNIIILKRLKNRHDEVSRHLPEAIDLLEICVSSGLGLETAWNVVADEIANVSPILSGAMALSNFEIHLGTNRVEAMRHMADRTGVEKLSSLAALLVQTERFGTSIGSTLRVFADSMREERDFAAQENAEKMAVKLIIPMVLFIFPAILVVVAGPAFITIATKMLTS